MLSLLNRLKQVAQSQTVKPIKEGITLKEVGIETEAASAFRTQARNEEKNLQKQKRKPGRPAIPVRSMPTLRNEIKDLNHNLFKMQQGFLRMEDDNAALRQTLSQMERAIAGLQDNDVILKSKIEGVVRDDNERYVAIRNNIVTQLSKEVRERDKRLQEENDLTARKLQNQIDGIRVRLDPVGTTKTLLNRGQAAHYLGVSLGTLDKLATKHDPCYQKKPDLPFKKIGKISYYHIKDLEAYKVHIVKYKDNQYRIKALEPEPEPEVAPSTPKLLEGPLSKQELLDILEAAQYLKVSWHTLRKRIGRLKPKLPVYPREGKHLYDVKDLERHKVVLTSNNNIKRKEK